VVVRAHGKTRLNGRRGWKRGGHRNLAVRLEALQRGWTIEEVDLVVRRAYEGTVATIVRRGPLRSGMAGDPAIDADKVYGVRPVKAGLEGAAVLGVIGAELEGPALHEVASATAATDATRPRLMCV
jgi:hypothetical protein